MKHAFTEAAKRKGWSLVSLASRWEISKREISNIAADPSAKELDALEGLPPNQNPSTRGEWGEKT